MLPPVVSGNLSKWNHALVAELAFLVMHLLDALLLTVGAGWFGARQGRGDVQLICPPVIDLCLWELG